MKTESRQSFLGADSDEILAHAKIGVVGLGGGGSHIVQQLAHLGFKNLEIFDPDVIELSNLNRLVGATTEDVVEKRTKCSIAERVVKQLDPKAHVRSHVCTWQGAAADLRTCDAVVSALDGLNERSNLEAECRRHLIPLIDIGMDVKTSSDVAPYLAGQIVLSMPGYACFRCLQFLTESKLHQEFGKYGDAGINPQVVWANGVLASTAVGILVDLLTDWSRSLRKTVYLQYQANSFDLRQHPTFRYLNAGTCPHFPGSEVGPTRVERL